MTIEEFIKENREVIDRYIKDVCPNCQIDEDDEREDWIYNTEILYTWAQEAGVKV